MRTADQVLHAAAAVGATALAAVVVAAVPATMGAVDNGLHPRESVAVAFAEPSDLMVEAEIAEPEPEPEPEPAYEEPYYEPYYEPVYYEETYYEPTYYETGYSGDGFAQQGVREYDGRTETWYSSNAAYHYRTSEWTVDDEGYYRTAEGYYVVAASDMEQGATFEGSKGTCQVLDSGCDAGVTDYYVSW